MSDEKVARVALITGAARGLGRAIAEAMSPEGLQLVLVDRLADRLEDTKQDLLSAGAKVSTFTADISDRESCREAVRFAIAQYGQLDVLVNCAGIARFYHATDVTEGEWNLMMAVNLFAPFWFCQAAIPELIKTRGNIVNVASNAASVGTAYNVPYSASKAGLVAMTKSLAMEFMDEPIRINSVLPGWMATEIGAGAPRPAGLDLEKVKRYQGTRPASEAREVAEFVAFIASPAASAIHGASLQCDRGATTG